MSLQETRERPDNKYELSSASLTSRRTLFVYPGERIGLKIHVKSPFGCRVRIVVEEVPSDAVNVSISPSEGIAPFTSNVDIQVYPRAKPGVYTLKLSSFSTVAKTRLSTTFITLVILKRGLPETLINQYKNLVNIYEKYGSQVLIWYMLTFIFKNGATFSQIKHAYELVTGRRVSNGTIGNILNRMKRKRIIREKCPGLYISNIRDFNILLSRVDLSRVRIQVGNATKRASCHKCTAAIVSFNEDKSIDLNQLPQPVRRVWERAQKIAHKYGTLTALYFLVYTLFGVRQTGYLLYWFNTLFIYCEQKTGFCHHFYSQLLYEMLKRLGLKEGVMYRLDEQHEKAKTIAQKHVKEYYGSHPSARRLHYLLKQLGHIKYDNEIYTLKIYRYQDGSIGLEIYDDEARELLHYDNVKRDETPIKVEIRTSFPFEHIDRDNEEVYFSRPSGLY